MDITAILEVVVLIVAALFVPLVMGALGQLKTFVKIKLTDQQLGQLTAAVRAGVLAVEQAGLSGTEARQEAISIVVRILNRQGLSADMMYIADLIEAEVFNQFNRYKLFPVSQFSDPVNETLDDFTA